MSTSEPMSNLTSGRVLARNTAWNLIGQLLPMAVGIVAIPPLVHAMGVDRFGVLSLAWIIVGYLGLLDLGMGRALTKLVSDKLGSRDEKSIPSLVWTSLFLLLMLGLIGGLITVLISPWLVHTALRIPVVLQAETLASFKLLAASIPIVTVTSGLRGILEAQQRFLILNFIRIPTSIFSFVGPLAVLPFSHSLLPVVIILTGGRLLGAVAHVIACIRVMPFLRHDIAFRREAVLPVVRFGGWMTVTNVIGPLMSYMDRFLLGALLSVGAVAYYSTPFDLVSRLTFLPAAVTGVLFPAFAASLVSDRQRTALLVRRGIKYVFLSMFPLTLLTVTFAPEALRLWLGQDFAHNSQSALRWLAAGVFLNSLASVPFAFIQSAGRPNLTAKLHLFELPLYLAAVCVLTKRLGIEGTAIAWMTRVVIDSIFLFLFAWRILRPMPGFLPRLAVVLTTALLVLGAASLPESLVSKIVFVAIVLTVYGIGAVRGMAQDERNLIRRVRAAKALGAES